MRRPIPFRERDSVWQQKLDLLRGKWPGYVFGLGAGKLLPVFKFSRVTRQELEPYFIYLMENGYRSLNSYEMESVLIGERPLGEREVVLTFDHAWASLWTVAGPLLERYNLQAVTYAIPGRIEEENLLRPVWGEKGHDPAVDFTEHPFCSWEELKKLHAGGRVDVQSNSWSHGKIFSHDQFLKLVQPETRLPFLSWPMLNECGESLRFLSNRNVFHPLLPARSRLSDGMQHVVDPLVVQAIHADPDAAPFLFKKFFRQIETETEREEAIRFELRKSREELEAKLGAAVHQFCFPWGVCGRIAASLLEEEGYRSAIAETLAPKMAAVPGKNPFHTGRLPYPFIRALPGQKRKLYLRIHQENAKRAFS